MSNFPFNQGNSQPNFNTFDEYQSYMTMLQSQQAPYTVNLGDENPNTPHFSTQNSTYYPNLNTQQYDAPTPNQGSSNRDFVGDEDDDEDDDEAVAAEEPILTPAVLSNTYGRNRASGKTSKRSWSHREEEALISCYMMHCTDATMSTNQNRGSLWRKVFASYEAARESRPMELPERNLNSMQLHWKRMCAAVMKWVGCYEEANRVKRSGELEKDVIEAAKTIYHHQEGKPFAFIHAWEKMKDNPKWITKVERFTNLKGISNDTTSVSAKDSDSSGKRLRVDDDVEVGDVVSNKSIRPDGVKKAKAKAVQQRKGKGLSTTSEDSNMSLEKKLQLYADLKGTDMSLKREKLEFDKEKEKRRKEQIELQKYEMKNNLLQTLLSKPTPLTTKEEMMKDKLMAQLYGD